MKAAQRLLELAAREGVRACFANPGTSEMHLVAALDAAPSIRPVLCLFEGVATGAADGFGRMAQTPALTLLHLGPGLGNGFANLHNAFRARTPIVSLVGEHATYHRANNPPLASDIGAIARPVSAWLETAEHAKDLLRHGQDAIAAARRDGPATLILPADVAWSDDEPEAPPARIEEATSPGVDVEEVARALGPRTLLLLGGRHLSADACAAAQRVAAATGALSLIETFPARVRREGAGAELKRVPYLSEMASAALAHIDTVILAGAAYPVAFFALPGRPLRLAPDNARVVELVAPGANPECPLSALAELVGATTQSAPRRAAPAPRPDADGAIDPMALAQCIAATLPDEAIVCDESNTAGLFCYDAAAGAPPHDWLTLTGGSIGQGLPLATGAAIACPERRVLALEADGSALYTIQSLWTQAREQLNITNVILNNGAYAILRLEMMRAGVNTLSDAANALFDLRNPAIDFCAIAKGFGVPAQRVATPRGLVDALEQSYRTPGPSLIEVMLP